MPSISLPVAMLGAGAVSAGASLIGSSNAASAQESAANTASDTEMNMFNKEQTNLQPYMTAGQTGLNKLTSLVTGDPASQEAALAGTPGYQFSLTQGLKATQNSAAARGLGVSGAAMKGAAGYATGLADNTYQQNVGNALNLANIGQTSAAGVGNAGVVTGSLVGNNQVGAGNAAASASIAGANAVGGLANSALGSYLTPQFLTQGGLYSSSNAGYNASTGGYLGMNDAQQDALQDSGFALPG